MDIYLWRVGQTNPLPVWKRKCSLDEAHKHIKRWRAYMESTGHYYQIFDPETGKELRLGRPAPD